VLAYVFWHHPQPGTPSEDYESAQVAFHRSLARRPPVGLRGSVAFRAPDTPWLQAPQGGYEDWYFVDDFAALGVLNEAAVGRGHRTLHNRAARHFGAGTAGLYSLLEGADPCPRREQGASAPATWVARPAGSTERALGELLGDGMDPRRASLWRRLLVLGPAPEYCLDAHEASSGVAETRLPSGWRAQTVEREVLYGG
jgi:hypothetical protein